MQKSSTTQVFVELKPNKKILLIISPITNSKK